MASSAVALIASIVALPVAEAATRTWGATGTSASFSTPGNWGAGGVPGSADTAAFTGSTATICNVTASTTVAAITVSGTATAALAITAGQTLTVTGDYTQTSGTPAFAVSGGVLEVTGAFNQSVGSFAQSSGTLLLDATSAKNLVTTSASFFNLTINDGLIGYWKFDEGSGSAFNDYSGYGFNGTLTGPTRTTGPTLNFTNSNAVTVNGSTQYGRVSRSTVIEPTAVTLSAWVERSGNQAQYGKIVSKIYNNDGASPYASYEMQTDPGNNDDTKVGFFTGHVGPAFDILQSATNALPDGIWTHVAMIYNPAGSPTKRIYINGTLNASSSTVSSAMLYDTSSTGDLWFGQGGTFNSQYYNGSLDDVRIYKRALTAAEINSLYIGNQPGTSTATQTMTGSPTVANDLTLASGTLSVGSNNLTVAGSWNNYGGLFSAGTGTVTLSSTGAEVIRSGGQPFKNLTLAGSGATWTLEDWLKVDSALTMTSGALSVGAYAVHASDLNKSSGTLSPGTGTVVIDTTTDVAQSTGFSFNNLRIEVPDETGLVSYWKFDEGQGTTIRDVAGTNNGTLTSTSWTDDLPLPLDFDNHAAVKFNASTSYATLGTTSLPANNASQSISFWANSGTNAGGVEHYMVSLWNSGSSSGTTVGLLPSGQIGAWKWGPIALVGATAPTTNAWHHVVYTYNSSGTVSTLYVDGSSVNTSTVAPNTATPINAQLGGFANSPNYLGSIDDLRIYNVTLTAAQVANLFAGNYAGTGSNTTVTLGANLTVNKTLAIDNGTLDTSSYTINAAATDSTQTALVNAGTLKVGSARATFNGGLTVGAQGTVTENTAGGAIALGAGEALEYGYSGTIQGFPTAAFDWSSFTFWREYVTYRSYTGSGTATDTVLALTADGGTKYAWALPTSKGSLLGTPRWNTEVVAMVTYHYIYLITTLGYVYKVLDSGSALTTVSGLWPYQNVTGGGAATATSPLVNDGSNLYWSGNDGAGLPKLFSLTLAGALNAALVVTATSSAAPALATVNLIPYVFFAISGKVYQETLTLGSQFTSTQGTTAVNGRISFNGNNLYFPENNGTIHARTASSTAGPTVATGAWPYQDTSATRHLIACSASPFTCPVVSNVYVDIAQSRICFGDADGHVYVLDSTGAPLTGFPWTPGSSADNFQAAPLSRNGVLLMGATNGNLYEIDVNNGTTRALTRTYVLPAAVSSISFNPSANGGSGGYVVGAAGKLYYLGVIADPSGPI